MNQSPYPPQSHTPLSVRPPDPIDQITGKLGQLYALLTSLHADGLASLACPQNFKTTCCGWRPNSPRASATRSRNCLTPLPAAPPDLYTP